MFLLTTAFMFIFAFAAFVPGKVYAEDIDINQLVGMMTGITVKITQVDPNAREMPYWFGVVYDTTNVDESYPAFASAECFAYLPCYQIQLVPRWNWLFQFLSNNNVAFPTFYASDLIPEMTPAYVEANCGQVPAASFKKKWAVQVVAGDAAYSYSLSDVYCTGYKVAETPNGAYISEMSFNLGRIVGDASNGQ